MKFGDRIPQSAIQHLPPEMTGPRVNLDFWNNHVSPASMGPIERGCLQQIQALRSIPQAYRIK